MSCDRKIGCWGQENCQKYVDYMERFWVNGIDGFEFPCQWDELAGKPFIADLPDEFERISNGELRDYMSAYYDDVTHPDWTRVDL